MAVIGLGSAGRRYAEIARETLPQAEILGLRRPGRPRDPLVDRTLHRLEDLRGWQPDVAIVCGPATTRLATAATLIDGNVHLLLEKPVSDSVAGVAGLAEAGRRHGVTVSVGYNLRFHDSLLAVRRELERGTLGRVLYVRAEVGQDLAQWRPGADYRETVSAQRESGGGALLELSHEIDYVLWLFGPAHSVVAEVGRLGDLEIDVEDTADIILRLESGALASLHLDMLQPHPRRRLFVFGSEASLDCDLLTGTIATRRRGVRTATTRKTEPVLGETYRALFADFLDAIERGVEPRSTLLSALATLEIVCLARLAAERGVRQGADLHSEDDARTRLS